MNIIDLAKQAEEYANNVVQSNDNDYAWGFLRDQKFAALVEAAARADEREECAKVCEGINKEYDSVIVESCADAIRERGTT
jgi:hypothetical protein